MNRRFFEEDEDMGVQGPGDQTLGGGYGGGNFHDPGMQPERRPDRRGAPPGESSRLYEGAQAFTRMPKGYARSDARIKDDVCEHLGHRHDLDLTDVSVDVESGTVRLEGSVTYRAMKHRIEDVAAACLGVADVDNRIRVRTRDAS